MTDLVVNNEMFTNRVSQGRGSVSKPKISNKNDNKKDKEEVEQKKLSQQIGIEYDSEKEKYNWFLSQVIKKYEIFELLSKISNLDLPFGWTKKFKNDTVYYYNSQMKIKTEKHPNLGRFRLIFQEILE